VIESFPDLDRDHLEELAIEHAVRLGLSREDLRSPNKLNPAVVNMLRHEFTDYDELGQTADAHREACRAIAQRFSWLGAECQWQIAQRKDERELAESMYQDYKAELEERKVKRLALAESSAEVIGQLSLGDEVVVLMRGREYSGVLTWLGHSRVEVTYRLKSGAERTKRVYAREVRRNEESRPAR
jgi:hypothetical protein